jgi:oligoribonuclease NrnB/cAMP/cGMP phosphodiesterase (DHH superfamily)
MNPLEIDIVFFHSPCQDGIGAAWVANKYAKENNLKYLFVGISNNSNPIETDINDKNIIFFDYAPSEEQIKTLNCAKAFFIVDHHKTNEERLKNYSNTIFNLNKSGAGLAWEYFYPDRSIPLFLQMIQDRDLWKWEIPMSRAFCDGLFTYCISMTTSNSNVFELFDTIHNDTNKFNEIYALGVILEKKKQKQLENIASTVTKKTYIYDNYKVCITNCDHELASDLGNMILLKYDFDFVVCWKYDHINEEYWLSLRANNKVDVSEICKKYGGGGHKNASGCSTKIHPSILFK